MCNILWSWKMGAFVWNVPLSFTREWLIFDIGLLIQLNHVKVIGYIDTMLWINILGLHGTRHIAFFGDVNGSWPYNEVVIYYYCFGMHSRITLWHCTMTSAILPQCCVIWRLTHWGRGKVTIIYSNYGLSSVRRQAIIWTNAGILLFWRFITNFNEIIAKIPMS